jgi:hypothetical protein
MTERGGGCEIIRRFRAFPIICHGGRKISFTLQPARETVIIAL